MQYALTLLALGASTAVAQFNSKPDSGTPGQCKATVSGQFTFNPVALSSTKKMARSWDSLFGRVARRQSVPSCGGAESLTLNNGQLLNTTGATGYIAANQQFQFDGPPQAGFIYTGGFSVCPNGTIALGDSTVFYSCKSGTFSNLYQNSIGAQCEPVFLSTTACAATGSVVTVAQSFTSPAGAGTDSSAAPTTSASSQSTSAPASTSAVATSAAATGASSAASVATPYPIAGNSTAPGATGTAPVITSSPAGTATATPSTFKGAASIVAVSQGFVAMIAAAGAMFLL